jgi:hypothetical protein
MEVIEGTMVIQTNELIERCAKAIAASDGFDPDKLAKSDPHLVMRDYRKYARAVIEEIREPTQAIIDKRAQIDANQAR